MLNKFGIKRNISVGYRSCAIGNVSHLYAWFGCKIYLPVLSDWLILSFTGWGRQQNPFLRKRIFYYIFNSGIHIHTADQWVKPHEFPISWQLNNGVERWIWGIQIYILSTTMIYSFSYWYDHNILILFSKKVSASYHGPPFNQVYIKH